MLESLAATLLNRLLGSYVENFDPTQLNVGIWSGDVRLRNLKLRKDCLDGLNLPVDVKFGILGELVLNVPWSSLKNKPVKINVEDCYILCSPRDMSSIDPEEQLERELRVKLRKLAEWELTEQARLSVQNSGSESEQNESFMQSLITKIVDNLQVTIKNIHIRYEDMFTVFSQDPCSIGLTLNELSAVSTDSNWTPSFISITQNITHKLLTLNSLCFYYNTGSKTIEEDEDVVDNDILFSKLKNSVATGGASIPNFQYILRPVTGQGQLSVSKLGSTEERPHVELKMLYDEFGVELDDSEYADILHTLSSIHLSQKTQKFKMYRPDYPVSENPRGWFEYVASCVIEEIEEKNNMWVWDNMKKRCDQRRAYVDLWVKKLRLKDLEEKLPDKSDEDELDQLHKQLDYDSIILFRTVAKRKFALMKLNSHESVSPPSQANGSNGWFSSWWGGAKQSAGESSDLVMTEEQRQELYDAIDFTEGQDDFSNTSIPKDRTTMKITSLLKKGAFSIKKKMQKTKIAEMIFENCEVEFIQRPDSFLTAFRLHEFRVEDGSTNTIYKHIISVKKQKLQLAESADIGLDPLFDVNFESNPLDESADSKLDVKLRGMTIFYHVHFINEITRFFNPPKQHLDTIGAIINAAEATVEGWTTQTRMGIESLLEEHKTANVTLDLQAPLIIVPLDPHIWDTPCAVIDAGHIALASDLVPKKEIARIKEMTPEEYSQIDGNELNKLMFDRFKLCLQDTQILIGPDIRSTIKSLDGTKDGSQYSILSGLLLELTLDISILPKAYNLPKVRAFAHLPKLNISLNDYQYKVMMQLLDKCTPSSAEMMSNDDLKDYAVSDDALDQNNQVQLLKNMQLLENMTPAELDQKLLDIQFDIDLVQISMFKCLEDKSMHCKKLIDVLGGKLKLNFVKKAKGMDLDLSMHSLEIEDFIEDNHNDLFTHLVSSSVLNPSGTKDLFAVNFKREQRIVHHKELLIEVFDQDIKINMAQLQVVLTPTSILTLMNYALTTFTDPDAPALPADALRHNKENWEDAPQKLTMNVNMAGMVVLLNDESIKLATLILSAVDFSMTLLPEKMRVNMKLGGLELTDEISESLPEDSVFRRLISMSDKDLAELTYETFDASNNPHNYDSILKYSTGSMNINFIEHSVNKLMNFFYKFQRMKTVFDSAREVAYNQAPSIDSVNNMKMDINIKAPVIQFPKLIDPRKGIYDSIKFYLGEVFIENSFSGDESEGKINHIKMGVRDGEVSSLFNFEGGLEQNLHIVESMCLTFNIDHFPSAKGETPEFKVRSYFDPLITSITELQLHYLINLSAQVAASFTINDSNSLELNEDVLNANAFVGGTPSVHGSKEPSPAKAEQQKGEENLEGKKLDFVFEAPEVSLTIYNETSNATVLTKCGLTKLKFQDIAISALYNNDGTADGESHIASFTVEDIRDSKVNKHTELIPKILNNNYQFMASLTSKKLTNGILTNVSVTIDSPQVVLAMDYLFALKGFVDVAFGSQAANFSIEDGDEKDSSTVPVKELNEESTSKFQYSLNIVNAALIMLADPSDIKSEAVIFNVGQFLISEQNITAISANNVGMSLSRMNSPDENKVGLLDEFSSSIVIDSRDSTPDRLLTNIQVSVEPMVMGISLRDIRLAMLIFNRLASQMNGPEESRESDENKLTYGMFSKEFEKKLSKYAPSLVSSFNANSKNEDNSKTESDIVLRGEKLTADFGGLRLFLIGDVHEMPILDMNISSFQGYVRDWSTEVDALASLEAYINVFNYSRSSWEPLVESFPISFHLSKGTNRDALLEFDVVSRKTAEVTLSSRSIAMLSQIPSTLTGDLSLKPRGALKPYQIVNDTGLDLDIWIVTQEPNEKKGLVNLKSGSTIDWEFEDWRRVRERLDSGSEGTTLAAGISGSEYKSIFQVDATHEGELTFTLEPSKNGVHNRIVCQLDLGEDNVKVIKFRSSLLLENTTSTVIQLRVESSEGGDFKTYDIQPSEQRSVPVEYAYRSNLKIRPLIEDEYAWSSQNIHWRDLLTQSLSLECLSKSDNRDRFYIEVNGKYDEKEPLAKIYPHMTLIISSPLIVHNMLPCSLNFYLFDKREDNRKLRSLEKGSSMPIHDVSLENFLLLSVQPIVDDAPISKPSIVNTARNSMLKPETRISCQLAGGQIFNASLHYQSIEGTRAKIIKISSPYIILNSTDRDLYIQGDHNNIAQIKVKMKDDDRYTVPRMFSFSSNGGNKNRARIRFKESDWSLPLSLDAIGQSLDTIVNIPNKEQESNIGVAISEGEGEYLMSKVIEISPRYIIQNCLNDSIEICEHGSTNILSLDPNISMPLYKMRNIVNKQLMVKFLGSNSDWSAPFFIKDIGLSYLKVLKQNSNHVLLKVEIILENATVFIRLKDAENRWPFSIRNFSDQEFVFYQRDPRVVDDYYDYDPEDELSESEYKPLYYRVPPKSVMPYAWDYPAARQKKILLTARGRRREIQLAQIGNMKPMRLPARVSNEEMRTVDLNVIADGLTQALVITNYNPEVSLYKLRTKQTSSSLSVNDSEEGFEVNEEDKNVYKRVVISFKGVGISLVNTSLEEIMYVHATGLELRYNESDLYQTLSWKLKWIQIDNQLFGSPFQNILYPFAVPHTPQEIENHPVISGSVSKVKDDSHGLIYFKHATLLLQELSIQLDEDLIVAVLDFVKFPGSTWTDSSQINYKERITLPECEDVKLADDMYFEVFHVQPMMLHLSFVRSDQHHLLSKEENGAPVAHRGAVLFLVDILTMTLANVNDAPIKLNSLYMANVRVPLKSLLQAVQTHYGQQFFYQVHKILGSADFLGNPVGLFNTISSGVWDIFYEPYQGYMMNDRPQELGINLAKGGLSFAKKTVFGLSDSMAKFTGSMAKGLSVTQGSQFQEQRRLQQRMNTNSRNVLTSSAQTFANTLGSGFTGIALDPMTGAQKEGTAGFLKGLGKGLLGFPAKTTIGLLDLTSSLSQGVKSTTTALDGPSATRFRLPRYIDYHEKVVKPFDLRGAQGQYWLKSVNGGLYMSDNYLSHVILPGKELAVIVSMEHIIELNLVSMETMWETTYRSIQGIVLQRGGIHIKLKSLSEFFIPISDPQERREMYKHIAVAVTEYNKYCEATL